MASLEADYVDESHIQAFHEALHTEDFSYFDITASPGPSAASPVLSPNNTIRVRKVSALSDFAPVNLRVRK
ncbi:hypothetical protein V5O48_009523 [Marasmius crinis-equi]|uniref:Uncharacterized protein n=1 Tax=Marasmius crinis-equi TaxID=585013 RepID=A0ABR3FAW0_9AGAR